MPHRGCVQTSWPARVPQRDACCRRVDARAMRDYGGRPREKPGAPSDMPRRPLSAGADGPRNGRCQQEKTMSTNAKGPTDFGEWPARPTRSEAEEAVRTLIRWAGDDPAREGLIETPARVVRAYEEFSPATSSTPPTSSRDVFGSRGLRRDDRHETTSARATASTTWCRSSARRTSATCRTAASSASRSSRGSSRSTRSGCRSRRR